jgi:NAD(P)-dependent dehydrogenase (short-subunit alcohol dehydrogenase family)
VRADERPLGRVLVTGGASGLGCALVIAVAEGGGRPYVLDLRRPSLDVEHAVVDLSDRRATERAVHRAASQMDGLDAVVTAAGIDACGPIAEVPAEQWESVIRVNLLGTAAVIRAALPYLERSHGRVVTVASTLGLRALPEASAYCASKFGVVGLTRALQAELSGRVAVTLLIPGGMRTAFFDGREERYRPAADAPLSDPRDVARSVVFALTRPPGCELRELIITPEREPSWP